MGNMKMGEVIWCICKEKKKILDEVVEVVGIIYSYFLRIERNL